MESPLAFAGPEGSDQEVQVSPEALYFAAALEGGRTDSEELHPSFADQTSPCRALVVQYPGLRPVLLR